MNESTSWLAKLKNHGFYTDSRSYAELILEADFSEDMAKLTDVLVGYKIYAEEMIRPGGSLTPMNIRLRNILVGFGWGEHSFAISRELRILKGKDVIYTSGSDLAAAPSHKVDHVIVSRNGNIALELEWNAKDGNLDRDLSMFREVHQNNFVTAGIVITRGRELHNARVDIFRKFAVEHEINSYEDLERFDIVLTRPQKRSVEDRLRQGKDFPQSWAEVHAPSKYGSTTTNWDKYMERLDFGGGAPCPIFSIGWPMSSLSWDTPPQDLEVR